MFWTLFFAVLGLAFVSLVFLSRIINLEEKVKEIDNKIHRLDFNDLCTSVSLVDHFNKEEFIDRIVERINKKQLEK